MSSECATRFALRRYEQVSEFHSHDHHQIVMPLEGVLAMTVDDRAGDVSDCRAAVVPAGQTHGFRGSVRNAFLIVDIPAQSQVSGDAQSTLWSAVGDLPFVTFEDSLRGFCDVVARDDQILHGASTRSEVAGGILVEALERSIGLSRGNRSRQLARAVAFVDAHYGDPISVAAIAQEAGLSESRLHALFEARLGLSPMRYVTRRRLEMAALLLEETPLSIAEIAHRVGYGDQSAFTRVFRREKGETPGAYRKRVGSA